MRLSNRCALKLRSCAAAELASVVGFLLQLGFREAGRPAPIGAFSPLERDVASHLAQLGLLLPFKCAGGSADAVALSPPPVRSMFVQILTQPP